MQTFPLPARTSWHVAVAALLLCGLALAPGVAAAQSFTEPFTEFVPLLVGYRYSFGEGEGRHHLSVGAGRARARVYDTIGSHHPAATLTSATVDIGLVNGRLVIAPTVGFYLAGGLAFGGNLGLAFDGDRWAVATRLGFGVGLIVPEENGFLMTYEFALTVPWNQDLIQRHSGLLYGVIPPR